MEITGVFMRTNRACYALQGAFWQSHSLATVWHPRGRCLLLSGWSKSSRVLLNNNSSINLIPKWDPGIRNFLIPDPRIEKLQSLMVTVNHNCTNLYLAKSYKLISTTYELVKDFTFFLYIKSTVYIQVQDDAYFVSILQQDRLHCDSCPEH